MIARDINYVKRNGVQPRCRATFDADLLDRVDPSVPVYPTDRAA